MFDNAIMLAGLGGAVVPLVIHLLGRARYRSVEWGAMMFIEALDAPRFHEPGRLHEWTLLGIRMAAVSLLAIALARPVTDSFGGSGGGGVGGSTSSAAGAAAAGGATELRAAAIVVDCSASMSCQEVSGTRMEQARRAVLEILSTMKRGDRVALYAASPVASAGELSGDLQAVAARAADLRPLAGQTDITATIEDAADLLGRQERVSRQLYVITDRQASSWSAVSEEFVDRWRAHAPLARFVMIPVGGAETDNLVVESLAVVNLPVVERCAAQVQVRVRNDGAAARTGVPVTLRLGTREVFTTTVNVPPRQAVTFTATIAFAGAGQQVLSAELRGSVGGAGATLDDRREIVVDVWPPLRTLLVRNALHGDGGDADVVRAALSPFARDKLAGGSVAAVEEVAIGSWEARDLDAWAVIVLDDVAALEPEQVSALEQFVYGGGGLVIAPGPTARTNEYNRLMYREEGALLPALLQPPLVPAAAVGIDRGSIEAAHPLLHFLSGQDVPLGSIHRYIATTARTPDARILASYTSGDPMVLEAPFGRGRVVLFTCSLRSEWTTLPLTPLYLPLLQSTIRYAAGARVLERNFPPGGELVARFQPQVPATRGVVIRPDRSSERCDIISAEGRSESRYADTQLAGVYTIRAGPRGGAPEPSLLFSIAPPAAESDLTPLDEQAWARLRDHLGFTLVQPDGRRSLAARLIGAGGGGVGAGRDSYWLAALAGVLGLFVIELALTRAWAAPPQGATR